MKQKLFDNVGSFEYVKETRRKKRKQDNEHSKSRAKRVHSQKGYKRKAR